MSNPDDIVKTAAAYLDKWYTKRNWRSTINLAILDMGSTENCILGQLFDSYYDGMDTLRNLSGREEFSKVHEGFCNYDSEWKNYLLNPPEWKGAEWVNRYDHHSVKKAITDHLFTSDGIEYVVWSPIDGTIRMNTRGAFEADFMLKPPTPVYTEGQLYKGIGNTVFMYGEKGYFDKPGFYNLNEGTYYDVEYFESTYGPLKPIQVVGNAGKPVIAKIG